MRGVLSLANWNIYVITHQYIFESLYAGDPNFSKYVKFVNVRPQKLSDHYSLTYTVLNLHEMPSYIPIGAQYAESEAIYNIYKNPYLYENLDFIGFIHYDHELLLNTGERNISTRINDYLRKHPTSAHISFATFSVIWDYFQHIMADEAQANTLKGNGRNCYDYILSDYNQYFKTQYTLSDLLNRTKINVCSSFLIDVNSFIKMMGFCSQIIESQKLNLFDTQRLYRLQGQLMERYFGVFLAFEYQKFLDLSLHHHYHLKNIP